MNRLDTPLAFDLCEYQFTHYGFFGRATNVVHHLYPPHLVGCLELFVDVLCLGKSGAVPRDSAVASFDANQYASLLLPRYLFCFLFFLQFE